MSIKPWRRLFLAVYIPFGLNLVVAAVLRDSLCRVIAALHCRLLYTMRNVERFVLTIIKRRLLLLLLLFYCVIIVLSAACQ